MTELISGSREGVHLFIDHGNFYTKTTTPIPVSSTLFGDGSREGARGARASFYFQTKLRPEKFFQRPHPRLSQGMYDLPPRPLSEVLDPSMLLQSCDLHSETPFRSYADPKINWDKNLSLYGNFQNHNREKKISPRSQLPLIEADQALVMLFMV